MLVINLLFSFIFWKKLSFFYILIFKFMYTFSISFGRELRTLYSTLLNFDYNINFCNFSLHSNSVKLIILYTLSEPVAYSIFYEFWRFIFGFFIVKPIYIAQYILFYYYYFMFCNWVYIVYCSRHDC